MEAQPNPKIPLRRLHQESCGVQRLEYDDYADVLEACNRKLAQWEEEGLLLPARMLFHQRDWLFRRQQQESDSLPPSAPAP